MQFHCDLLPLFAGIDVGCVVVGGCVFVGVVVGGVVGEEGVLLLYVDDVFLCLFEVNMQLIVLHCQIIIMLS